MSMSHASVPTRRLNCECLEGRVLLSATPLLPLPTVPSGPIAVAVKDLDNDGSDDFVFANPEQGRVVIRRGDQNTDAWSQKLGPMAGPRAVHLADLDRDGIDDLIVCNTEARNVLVYLGLGAGQFGPEVTGGAGVVTGDSPISLAVGNLDGDDLPDFVVANAGSNDVTVLLGEWRDGGWGLRVGQHLDAGREPAAVALYDLDGDGLLELVVTNRGADSVSIRR